MSEIGQANSNAVSNFNLETGQEASNEKVPKVRASCGSSKPVGSFHAQLIHLKKYEMAQDQILSMIESLREPETWMIFSQVFVEPFGKQTLYQTPLFGNIDLEAINKEFNEYLGHSHKSTIFKPLKVPIQCKLMQKVLPLVTAEDDTDPIRFHRLQIALMYLYSKEKCHNNREIETEMRPFAVR